MPAGGELAAKLARARQWSQDYDIRGASVASPPPSPRRPTVIKSDKVKAAAPPPSPTVKVKEGSTEDKNLDISSVQEYPQTPPMTPAFSSSPDTLQKENKKLLELLKEKDAEIRDLKKKLVSALANSESSPMGRDRRNTTDRFNKVLNDRLSVMGINASASSLQISDFVEDEEGGEEDDGNIFKGVGSEKPNQSTLFDDDDDDDDMYDYGTQGKYIHQINNSEQMNQNAFTKKSTGGGEEEQQQQQQTGSDDATSSLAKYGLGEGEQGELFANEGRQQVRREKKELSYKEFLERLMLPDSADLVDFIRRFIGSILGPNGDGTPPPPMVKGVSTVDYEFYGSREVKDRCAGFGYHMECTFETHPAWKEIGDAGLISARNGLEKYVMTKIADMAFKEVMDDEADRALQERCKKLRFVTPDMLDVKKEICNETVFDLAQDELKKVNSYRAPGDKINAVAKSCSLIFSAFKFGNGSAAGADEFLPVFILVVLGANVPRLISNCDYIEAYTNRNTLMTKQGYCFCNLRSAIEFIMTADDNVLNIDKEEFQMLMEGGGDGRN